MGRAADFAARVHRVVASIPKGRVATYGTVATMAGSRRAARAVGSVLSALPDGSALPWWRVVGAGGRIVKSRLYGGARIQRALLEREGVRFDEQGAVRLDRHQWLRKAPLRTRSTR